MYAKKISNKAMNQVPDAEVSGITYYRLIITEKGWTLQTLKTFTHNHILLVPPIFHLQ